VSTGGIQRLVTLPPAPDSARQARRFVADVLTSIGVSGERLDTAVLLTSELVTNGIVHALTELQIAVEATPTWVRVEVCDGSSNLPRRRDGYDDEAMTGRGLEMVELLSDDFGMQLLDDDGKRVWFRLGGVADDPVADEVAARVGSTADVILRNVPIALYCAWQQHADAILREALIAALDDIEAGIPDDMAMANDAMSALGEGTAEAFALRAEGVAHAEIVLSLPHATVPHFPVLRDVLRCCSSLSMAGQLLVPPALPEIQAVRNWVCGEVGRQTTGLAPSAYSEQPDTDLVLDEVGIATLEAVRQSELGVIAADRANRIIAVSESAAEALGWTPAELEGHRLVAIVPPRLRDEHVAGFTRYLLDGTSTIFGRHVEMPALHRDGHEVPMRLFIDRGDDPAAGEYFVATVTPL
jgi:PAS domain S-box-containing protein